VSPQRGIRLLHHVFTGEDPIRHPVNTIKAMPQTLFETLIAHASNIARWLDQLNRSIRATPPTPGIEDLLIKLGHEDLQARVMARVIQTCGERWAEERGAIEKPFASALRQVLKNANAAPLVISRRARALQAWLDSRDTKPLIQSGLESAGLLLSVEDLREITALAAERDERACRRLVEIAQTLVTHIPDPRGRPVSTATGIHLFLLLHLGLSGHRATYTWSDEMDDFVDPLTKATRMLCYPDFDPRPATRLYRKGAVSGP
jgi:hypothetical protein